MTLLKKRAIDLLGSLEGSKRLLGKEQELFIMGCEIGMKDQAIRIARCVKELSVDKDLTVNERQILMLVSDLILSTSELKAEQ